MPVRLERDGHVARVTIDRPDVMNAIDAGAARISVTLAESGRAAIVVADDGKGMTDAELDLAVERHATSKIRRAEDLFNIVTMGFRGEALASIAAIAQVELRTQRRNDELGTKIIIEGFELKSQEACQTPVGTNIQIKNLFFKLVRNYANITQSG